MKEIWSGAATRETPLEKIAQFVLLSRVERSLLWTNLQINVSIFPFQFELAYRWWLIARWLHNFTFKHFLSAYDDEYLKYLIAQPPAVVDDVFICYISLYRRFTIDYLMFSFFFCPFHNLNLRSDEHEERLIYLTSTQVLNGLEQSKAEGSAVF